MKTTGFSQAGSVPVGTTISRVYFCEPGHGGPVSKHGAFDTYSQALTAAIAGKREELAKQPLDSLFPESITVDSRWVLTYPTPSGSRDVVAERTSYDSLADAEAHLARMIKFKVA